MYRETIMECATKVTERDQLRTEKNQLRKNIEDVKIKEESCVKTLRELESKIPQQKSTVASLQEEEDRLKKVITLYEQRMEKKDMKLIEIKEEITKYNDTIVTAQEAEAILASRENVEKQLEEQEEIILAGRQKLKENSLAIEKMQSITSTMEHIYTSFSFDTSDFKNMKKNLDKIESNVSMLKNNIIQYESEIESLTQGLKMKRANIIKLQERKDEIEATIGEKDKIYINKLKEQRTILRVLERQEDELLLTKQRIKDELDILYKISSNVIKQMSESFYDH